MSQQRIPLVLLPGMDGTGRLFRPLLDALPKAVVPTVVSYPTEGPLGYAQCEEIVRAALPRGQEFALLGESYSGPIAIRVAARHPPGLRAVVLTVSFAQAPRTRTARILTRLGSWPFGIPPPAWLVRKFLLGLGAPAPLVAEFKRVVRSVRKEVLAARLREILAVDVCEEFKACPYPMLCLAANPDRLVPERIYQAMSELRPDAELVTLEGPHCLLQRNPAAAGECIGAFLRRVFARSPIT